MTSEELAKALRNCSDCYCGDCKYNGLMQPGNCVKCMNKLIDDAADEIIRLQEANNDLHETVQNLLEQFCSMPFDPLPEIPRWVSVDERLPKLGEKVLVWYLWHDKSQCSMAFDEMIIDSNSMKPKWKNHHWQDHILFWQSLPEPPKEET